MSAPVCLALGVLGLIIGIAEDGSSSWLFVFLGGMLSGWGVHCWWVGLRSADRTRDFRLPKPAFYR